MFLLDTDHITILQRRTPPLAARMLSRMAQHPPGEFHVSIVSFHEQVLGWNSYISRARTGSDAVRAYAMFDLVLTEFAKARPVPFDEPSAAMFDSLRAQRVRVGTLDLRLAAIALVRGMTVLTRNVGDFRKVPGLSVEDWTL
jgi:tRNA(fMet)-specific endonuclease VapC